MQLLATGAQQRAVGSVLHQRVFEGILGVRRNTAPEDQLGGCELVEGVVQLLLRYFRDCAYELVRDERPSAAPIWATSRIGARRSRRARSDACSDVGIATGAMGPAKA